MTEQEKNEIEDLRAENNQIRAERNAEAHAKLQFKEWLIDIQHALGLDAGPLKETYAGRVREIVKQRDNLIGMVEDGARRLKEEQSFRVRDLEDALSNQNHPGVLVLCKLHGPTPPGPLPGHRGCSKCFIEATDCCSVCGLMFKHLSFRLGDRPICATCHDAQSDAAMKATSTVDHPGHYGGDTPHETIKCLEAWGLDSFCLGNAVKYIARAGKKNPKTLVEDLEKARWYLDREIARRRG